MAFSTNLTAKVDTTLSWTYRNIDSDSGQTVTDSHSVSLVKSLANGTAVNQADVVWFDYRTLTDASNDDLDLAGVLTDSFGGTITFAKVKGLVVKNLNSTAGETLIVGGEPTNPFSSIFGDGSDTVVVQPSGIFVLWTPSAAGYAVTAGTGDILRTTASGGNINYEIAIVGTTA